MSFSSEFEIDEDTAPTYVARHIYGLSSLSSGYRLIAAWVHEGLI